jgi:hypothetical protein
LCYALHTASWPLQPSSGQERMRHLFIQIGNRSCQIWILIKCTRPTVPIQPSIWFVSPTQLATTLTGCSHFLKSSFHDSCRTCEYDATCYTPRKRYSPTNSRHPRLGFLFPHSGTHQFADASLVRSSFHPTKPLQTYSDASRRVFRPSTNHF